MMIRGGCTVALSAWLLASGAALHAQESQVTEKAHTATASVSKLADYVGQYRETEEPDVVGSVYIEGNKLYIEGKRSPRVELQEESVDHFAAHGLKVVFVRNSTGKVSGLRSSYGGRGGDEVTEERFSDEGVRLNHFREYTRSEAMIPVRDGVKLHVVILRPAGSETSGEALPFLMQRTPYGVEGASSSSVNGSKPELAASGYIFVYGDIRGRYGSEGKFVMNRAIVAHTTKNDVDETTDTRDTIDWLLKNVAEQQREGGCVGCVVSGISGDDRQGSMRIRR